MPGENAPAEHRAADEQRAPLHATASLRDALHGDRELEEALAAPPVLLRHSEPEQAVLGQRAPELPWEAVLEVSLLPVGVLEPPRELLAELEQSELVGVVVEVHRPSLASERRVAVLIEGDFGARLGAALDTGDCEGPEGSANRSNPYLPLGRCLEHAGLHRLSTPLRPTAVGTEQPPREHRAATEGADEEAQAHERSKTTAFAQPPYRYRTIP